MGRRGRFEEGSRSRAFSSEVAPVRVKKTRQNKRLEPRSDSIRTEKALGVRQQMVVRQQMHGEVAAKRGVAVAAVTADAGNLGRALIEVHVVGLVSIGCGIGTGDRNVDRGVDRDIEVDEAAGEMAVAADACTVVARRYDVRTDQARDEGGETRVSADRDI